MSDRVRSASVTVAEITPKTRWIFVELRTDAGLCGFGEATAQRREADVCEAFRQFAPMLFELPHAVPLDRATAPVLTTLAEAAAYSAADQALWDLAAQRREVGIAELLGGERRRAIPLYANINRRTADRSPAGFAASARAALEAGFDAFKIAPFDEVDADARRDKRLATAMGPGVARVQAVREAVGPEARLMIDCHWRFDVATAERVIDAAAEIGIYWVECPLAENNETLADLRRLRARANGRGIRLAGCEEMIRIDGFSPFLDAGAYDVIMPDMKYVGGLAEMMALAEVAAESGTQVSPHNPSGPVCHAASLQVCAAMADPGLLEVQFDETPLFAALQSPPLPPLESGAARLPATVGLGIGVDRAVLGSLRHETWSAP